MVLSITPPPRPDGCRHRRERATGSNTSPAVSPGTENPGGTRAANLASPTRTRAKRTRPRSSIRSILADSRPGAGRGDIDEFRPHADLDFGARRQAVVAAVQRDGVAVDPRLAAAHLGRHDVHAGRADEIADKSMRGLVEQFGRRAALHHAAVMHHHHGIGEGQRLGLVVGDIDHGQVELAVQRLELRAQLPFQFGIDHRQRLVEQHRGDVGAHQAAAERDLLLGVGGQPRRLAVEIGREIEQPRDLGDPRVDLGLRHAAVLQRKCQVLSDRHGVVDHRKLEHLRDIALLG